MSEQEEKERLRYLQLKAKAGKSSAAISEQEEKERLRYLQLKAKTGKSSTAITEQEEEEKKGFWGGIKEYWTKDIPETFREAEKRIIEREKRTDKEYWTKDIPETFREAEKRIIERGKRTYKEPTVLGDFYEEKAAGPPLIKNIGKSFVETPERLGRLVTGAFGDVAEFINVPVELSMKTINRVFGGIPGKIIKEGVTKGIQTKAGQKAIEIVTNWWGGLSEADKANYKSLPDVLDMLGFAPSKQPAKQVIKQTKKPGFIKQAFSKYSEVPSEALEKATSPKTLKGISESFEETGGDLFKVGREYSERIAAKRNEIDNLFFEAEKLKNTELEKELFKGKNYTTFSKSDPGLQIKEKSLLARTEAGKRFELGQSDILIKKGAGKIPTTGRRGKNILQNEVDGFLKRIKYDEGKGFGKVGNRVIPEEAVSIIKGLYEQIGKAKNLDDALFMRRLIDQKINFGRDGRRLFERGSDADWALTEVRNRFNDAIEKKMSESLMGETFVTLWKENNKKYSIISDALSDIEKTLSMGKTSSESYIRKISNIGIDKLEKLSKVAEIDDIAKPVWRELKNGFYDDIILSSVGKEGIDYNAFVKKWNSLDPKIKKLMIATDDIKRIDEALIKYSPEDFTPSTFGADVFGKTLDPDKTTRTLENIGSKAHRGDIERLRLIDDLLGNEGDKRISDLAEKIYLGKQLKMTPEGKLPAVSDIKTGKSWAGMAAGSGTLGTIGAAIGGPTGAAVGSFTGVLSGMYLQSPSAALIAYKTLNKMGIITKETGGLLKQAFKKPVPLLKGGTRAYRSKSLLKSEEEEEKKPHWKSKARGLY